MRFRRRGKWRGGWGGSRKKAIRGGVGAEVADVVGGRRRRKRRERRERCREGIVDG